MHVAKEVDIVFTENMTKGEDIDNEEQGPRDWAMGHTRGDWKRVGGKWFKLDELRAIREIWFKPSEGCLCDADRVQSVQENGVRNGIKCRT